MTPSASFRRRTKIICTIGPASGSAATIEQLIRAGMDIARLNLSHGTRSEHRRYIERIRKLSRRMGAQVAILADLPGPKYRVSKLKDGQVVLKRGAEVMLTSEHLEGTSAVIPVNLPNLVQDVRPRDTILLDDGAIQLRVLGKKGLGVNCRVTVGGVLAERRGLVVPGMRSSSPFLSDSLRSSLLFAIREEADYLALSFVNSADDVAKVKEEMAQHNADIPIIAKIERGEAVRRFDSILAVSDGVMVARGDLGVDIPLERVPLVQKELISKCNRVGKTVITATQMLESMVNSARPTRAEVTDVANAIFDGTDAAMLSAETSIGKRPVQVLRTMDRIAREIEREIPYEHMLAEKERWLERETDELIAYSACHSAQRLKAVAIVAYTQSGSTARRVSKYRPVVPILAMTPSDAVSKRLLLYRGVYPFQVGGMDSVDDLFADGVRVSRAAGIAKSGDLIVITGGVPIGVTGSTNLLKVEGIN